jgi:hypothetical protein
MTPFSPASTTFTSVAMRFPFLEIERAVRTEAVEQGHLVDRSRPKAQSDAIAEAISIGTTFGCLGYNERNPQRTKSAGFWAKTRRSWPSGRPVALLVPSD